MPTDLPEGFILDDDSSAPVGVAELPEGFVIDPDPPTGEEYARDLAKSVVRGATSEGVQMAAEGVYRGLAENIALVDRDQQLREEIQSAQARIADLQKNTRMIPEAREAGLRGEQERINRANEEQISRRTPGTPQNQEFQAYENSPATQVADTLRTFADEAASQRQAVREALPVSQAVAQSIPGQLAQGAGQLINAPAYVVPGVGPAVSVAQLYQEGYDDYVNAKKQRGEEVIPSEANEAATTYAAAAGPIDVLVDSLPAGQALKALVGKAPIKQAIAEIGKIALAGGASEGFQQATLNTIASQLAQYDPDRPLTQDVLNSTLIGAAVSGVGATGAEVAGRFSQQPVPQEVDSRTAFQKAKDIINSPDFLSPATRNDPKIKALIESLNRHPLRDWRNRPPRPEEVVKETKVTALDAAAANANQNSSPLVAQELSKQANTLQQTPANIVAPEATEVERRARQEEILSELDQPITNSVSNSNSVVGDEQFAPSEQEADIPQEVRRNAIREASIAAENLLVNDPDQVGQSSLRDWRSTLPSEVASNVQAHGAPIGELQNILDNGIDPDRPFYTAPLNDSGSGALGLRDVGTGGQVLILGAPGQQIKDSGVQAVVVNDYLAPSIPQLQAAYPNVTWLNTQNATQWLNEQQSTGLAQLTASNQEQAIISQEGVTPQAQEVSPATETQIGEPNATQTIQQQEGVPTEREIGNQGGTQAIPSSSNSLLSEAQSGQEVVLSNNNENAQSADSGGVREAIQPFVAESQAVPSQGQNQPPQRVQIGSSPQPYEVLGPLPQTEVEKRLGEQYFQVRNERTGQEQVVEKNDMRLIGAKLGPGAANIEEPLVQYEERSFGQRLDADETLDPTLRENIGDKYYSPIPNNVTAEQAREIIAERGIDDTISAIRDENNGIPFHVRSVLGQTIIRNLNQQYAAIKESNPQDAQKILDKTVELAEWQQDFGTRLGQGVQSFAMWSRLTPEGMLITYQKGVKKARDRYEQTNPGEVDDIITAINKAVPKDKPAVIDDLADKGNKTAKKVRNATDKIIKAGKGKDLTSPEFFDAVSEELGLPKVSPEISTKILDLAEKVAAAPEGIPKDRATLALTKYIATQKGFKASDLPLGIFYGNILSGYNTHLVNAIDTMGNVNSEIFGLALANPKAALKIYGSLLRGFSEGKADALMALTEGRIATDEKWMDVPKLMEVAQFGVKGGVPIDTSTKGGQIAKMLGEGKLATPLNLYKYVGRALAASDAFNFRGAKEAKAAALAYQMATSEGKKGDELLSRMDQILALDKMPNLLLQAEKEGFTGQQATARAIELREQLRDSGISDASSEFAAEATYNHKPYGSLGILANSIESASNKILPLKLFVPFTRIVANVTNRSLNYTPYGYKRAFMGYLDGDGPPIGDAKAQALARANIGTTALGILAVLAAQGLIEINGGGPSDDEKRKQLMSAGWKPYSIKIGDTYWNYLLTPIGLGLSVIGNMVDSQKYNELGNKDAATRAVYALGRIGGTVASQSFISGLSSLFKMLSDSPGEAVTAIKGMFSNTTSGFTTPTLVRDVNRLFNNKLYQSDGIAGDFIKNTPFAGLALKPALNALGEPVTLPRQRFFTQLKDDAAWRVIVDQGLRIPVPSKTTAAKPGQSQPLSSTQYYHYLEETGKLKKNWITKNEARLRSLDQEQAQELLRDASENINKIVLPRIRREIYTNP